MIDIADKIDIRLTVASVFGIVIGYIALGLAGAVLGYLIVTYVMKK